MRWILFIVLLLSVELYGFCQPVKFNKTYNFGGAANPIFGELLDIGNDLIVNGNVSNPNRKILMCKSDELGYLTDTAFYGADTGNYVIGQIIRVPGDKVLGIYVHESSMYYVPRQYILIFNLNLSLAFDSIYYNTFTYFTSGTKVSDNYYFAGNTFYDNNGDSLNDGTNALFWSTDTNFNHVSSNSIGDFDWYDNCHVIQAGFDNNLLLGGVTRSHAPAWVLGLARSDWYLINTDTSGQVIGEYFYGVPEKTDWDGMKEITRGSDSTYFLAGLYDQYKDSITNAHYYSATVVKINRQFETLWKKDFSEPLLGPGVYAMIGTSDGNQALLFQKLNEELRLLYGISTKFSKIVKFNNDGDVLWSRNYYRGDTNTYITYRAWELIETTDKGFALCGYAYDTNNVGPDIEAWLVKTDSLGCDDLRSCDDTILLIQPLQTPDTLCMYDTNWVNVEINGRSAPYTLSLSNGQVFTEIYYPSTAPPHIVYSMPVYPEVPDTNWQLIVTLTDPWGASISDTMEFYVKDCFTGFADRYYSDNKISIYPNPTSEMLNICIHGVMRNPASISVYRTDGSLCIEKLIKNPQNILDISKLSSGLYLVKVQGTGYQKTERIVVY